MEGGKVVEMQALWDIPELMMQARAWPMAPGLGREWQVPGPATQDGLVAGPCERGVIAGQPATGTGHAGRPVEVRHGRRRGDGTGEVLASTLQLVRPQSGIGTGRGIAGFRNWHQIPFLNGMPDRRGTGGKGKFFADGDYVGFTAWPGMCATITGDGWLGIAPSGQKITMRSLDFWRCENGLIRENWVLVDLLHVYRQIGVDVLARMREFKKARVFKDFQGPS